VEQIEASSEPTQTRLASPLFRVAAWPPPAAQPPGPLPSNTTPRSPCLAPVGSSSTATIPAIQSPARSEVGTASLAHYYPLGYSAGTSTKPNQKQRDEEPTTDATKILAEAHQQAATLRSPDSPQSGRSASNSSARSETPAIKNRKGTRRPSEYGNTSGENGKLLGHARAAHLRMTRGPAKPAWPATRRLAPHPLSWGGKRAARSGSKGRLLSPFKKSRSARPDRGEGN
jgi:hypothetical protein